MENQAGQMATLDASGDKARQEQTNQVMENSQIRTDDKALPINFATLKATKRKRVDQDSEGAPTRKIKRSEKYNRSDAQELSYITTLASKCYEAYNSKDQESFDKGCSELLEHVQKIELSPFICEIVVKKSHAMGTEGGGLSCIFRTAEARQIFSSCLRADAKALYDRWDSGDFAPDIFRGIQITKVAMKDGKTRNTPTLDPNYAFTKPWNIEGHNGLASGRWFANRACAIRDGAHGELEAGISGVVGLGAFSVVIAHSGYDNIDNGNEVQYCGTQSSTSKPTKSTSLLDEAKELRNRIRVLRGSALNTKYAPKEGIRYDGLYKIVGKEILNAETSHARFTLERLPNQDPIRFEGELAKPNPQELKQFRESKKKPRA